MKESTMRLSAWWQQILPVIFVLGMLLLLATWALLYWTESLFTESHLVGYYCCVSEQDLPAIGTLERMLSDFFRTSPGKHLPSLLLISITGVSFVRGMRKRPGNAWLPFLFVLLSVLYLVLDFWLIGVSWSISNAIVGPQTSAYKGYHRTWYGIVLHLLLWGGLLVTMAQVSARTPRERT